MKKGKEVKPYKTITKIRNLLFELNIMVKEKKWEKNNGFFSVGLQLDELGISTYGKGSNSRFALASAYGEMIERLQNQYLFQKKGNYFCKETNNKFDFIYFPDEKYLSKDEFLNQISKKTLKKINCLNLKQSIFFKSLKSKKEMHNKKFISIPFYNSNNKKIVYLPISLLHLYYGSNGMVAGNTKEEAIVQGLSEIFEGFSLLQIIKKNITPPTIPMNYIKNKNYKSYKKVKKIEKKYNYKIIVKDCSLNLNLPVLAILVIDKKNNKYAIRFGSYPKFNIALERCISEFFQVANNYEPLSLYFSEFNFNKEKIENPKNLERILRTGKGFYPSSFFNYPSNYEFDKKLYRYEERKSNNTFFLEKYLQIINNLNYSILIRNVSYFGFPSYQIIIPGMSELIYRYENPMKKSYKRNLRYDIKLYNYKNNKKILKKLKMLYSKKDKINFGKFLGISNKNTFKYNNLPTSILLTAINYKLENYYKAYKNINEYIEILKNKNFSSQNMISYYKCIRSYLSMKISINNDEYIKDILKKTYSKEIYKKVKSEFIGNKKNILKDLPDFNCFKCQNCTISEYCNYELHKSAYLKIKKKINKTKINQKKVKTIFES